MKSNTPLFAAESMNAANPEIYLKTKLIRPQVREDHVSRQRLLGQLDKVFSTPLTLVCAPAGYGKTTLLVDWSQNCPIPVVWLSLDANDNDPEVFLSYLILTLQQLDPQLGKSAQVVSSDPGNGLRLLVNDLAELAAPAVLVLDDVHLIEAQTVHRMLSFLVEHLPPTLRLVMASRTEPPIALARLRARSAVFELRASDLCFRTEEIKEFLNQDMRLDLDTETRRRLEIQTEGWAAGLQLAALSLRSGEGGIDADVFHSGHHYIFDYLAEEVLHHLSEPMQRFLLHTSILEQITGPLSEVLADPFPPYHSGAECLDALEHANLFTQALDGEHTWYRFHALFAEFLLQRLQQTEPETIPLLHSRAARWLAEQGSFEAACQHAIAGKDQELLIWLVDTYAQAIEKQGDLNVLSRWIHLLPEPVIQKYPRISLAKAWVAATKLDVKTAQFYLEQAESHLAIDNSLVLKSELLTAHAFLAGIRDQSGETQAYTQQALQILPEKDHFLKGLLKINLSFPMMMSGDLTQAILLLEEAVADGIRSNSLIIAILGMRILGEAYIMNGRLSQAERVFRQGYDYIQERLGKNSIVLGVTQLGLGEVYRQRNDLTQAQVLLNEGLKKTLDWMPAMGTDGFIWLSALEQAMGRPAAAQNLLRQARQASESNAYPLLDGWFITIMTIRLDILQGYLEEGLRWARSTGLDLDGIGNLDQVYPDTPNHFREMAFYTLARLFLMLGQRENLAGALDKAAGILVYTLPMSEKAGAYAQLLEGLLLLAQVEQARGCEQAAQDALHRALDLAAPERSIRIFLDEGETLMALFAKRKKLTLPTEEREFLEILSSAWENQVKKVTLAALPVMAEPLTYREVEVLRWIAAGKSNQEIADGLVLSLNTVKKHVSAVIDKLDATNRTKAVLIARQLGIIE